SYRPEQGLKQALQAVVEKAEQAVRSGKVLLVLSDRDLAEGELPINAFMATGAVHYHLVHRGLRSQSNIIVETGWARDPHQFAVLIGFGATAVYPYLSYQVLNDLISTSEILMDPIEDKNNYRRGINTGLLKNLSKMGRAPITTYS